MLVQTLSPSKPITLLQIFDLGSFGLFTITISPLRGKETETNRRTLSTNYLAEYMYVNVYTSKIFTYILLLEIFVYNFGFFFSVLFTVSFYTQVFLIYTWRHYLLLGSFIKHIRTHFNWFCVLKYHCSNGILPVKLQTSEFVRPYITYASWLYTLDCTVKQSTIAGVRALSLLGSTAQL